MQEINNIYFDKYCSFTYCQTILAIYLQNEYKHKDGSRVVLDLLLI